MSILTLYEQMATALRDIERPLIVIPADQPTDVLAAGIFLTQTLRTNGITASMYIPGTKHPLPIIEWLYRSIPQEARATDPKQAYRWKVITPHTTHLLSEYIAETVSNEPPTPHLEPHGTRYDAMIVLGISTYAEALTVSGWHAQDMRDIPVFVMSADPGQERYGHINVVDVTAPGVGTMVWQLIHTMNIDPADSITQTAATAAYISILLETESWSNRKVTSSALQAGSTLLMLGADRANIDTMLSQLADEHTVHEWAEIMKRLTPIAPGIAYALCTGTPMLNNETQSLDRIERARFMLLIKEFLSSANLSGEKAKGIVLCWPEANGLCLLWHRDSERLAELAREFGTNTPRDFLLFRSPSLATLSTEHVGVPAMISYLASLLAV